MNGDISEVNKINGLQNIKGVFRLQNIKLACTGLFVFFLLLQALFQSYMPCILIRVLARQTVTIINVYL